MNKELKVTVSENNDVKLEIEGFTPLEIIGIASILRDSATDFASSAMPQEVLDTHTMD